MKKYKHEGKYNMNGTRRRWKKHLHKKPIVLLDDIFDKLDNERGAKLMKLVSENVFGQVIVTDTDSTRVQSIFEKINVPYKEIPMMYQADLQTNGWI